MLEVTLDKERGLLHLAPHGPLSEEDFARAAQVADPFIERNGKLKGIVVDAPAFPGWDSFGALAAHIRFVRDHHRNISRVALVSDSHLGSIAETLGSHFVSAEVRHFPAGEVEAAAMWASEGK